MDGGFEWRLDSRKLSSLCSGCSDWMLRISSSVRNNLVSFDWFRTGAEHDHLLILTNYLHQNDSEVSTCSTALDEYILMVLFVSLL